MPSLWSGSISFGLVSIPVRLEVSRRSQNISFNLLHGNCKNRIKLKHYCPTCDQYLERGDLIKGYQYQKDTYVTLSDEDFEQADAGASRSIEVISFVDNTALKPVHLNKTYYLVPQAGAEKSYLLLLKGMQETNKIAITRFVMRSKEYIGAVGFAEDGLLLHVLFHQGEFKQLSDVFQTPEIELKQKELLLAVQIIENLSEDFAEDMLADEYRQRLMTVIQQKIEGEQVFISERKQPAEVIDLMEALKKSLEATRRDSPSVKVEETGRTLQKAQA